VGWAISVSGCAPAPARTPPPSPPVVQVLPPPPTAVASPRPEPERPAPPVYDEVKDAAAFLVDELERRELRRAYLATADAAYWTLGEAEVEAAGLAPAGDLFEPSEVLVAEHHPEHLRIRVAGRGVELFLYLSLAAFAETTRHRTPLLRSSGRPFVDAGVSLPPGAKLELSKHRGGLRRAVVQTDWFSAEGALHEENLGRVFRLETPREDDPDRWAGPFDCAIDGGTVLRAEPDGAEVARLGSADVPCRHLADLGGWHRVLVERGGYEVRGVAPTGAIELGPASHGYGTTGGSGGWCSSHTTYRFLWPRDQLFSIKGAALVGRVITRRLRVGDSGPTIRGLHSVRLPLPHWGFNTLGIEPQTLEAAIAKEARYQGRVAFEHLRSPTGHKVDVLREGLEGRRQSVNRCFDAALRRKGPGATFRYQVTVRFGPSSPPTLRAFGGSEANLERCLRGALRVRRAPGNAVTRFVLRLTPDPAVGP